MNRILALLIFALILPGCWVARTHTNAPLDPALVEAITPGQTTAAEVVEVLGAPAEIVQLGRRSAYRYEYSIEKGLVVWIVVAFFQNKDTQSDRVWIWFDEEDRVSHVGSSFESGKARYNLPWTDRD